MAEKFPTVFQMIRGPFLSSILAPSIAGTLLAVVVTGSFSFGGLILVLIIGIGLHAATNVYNDIYDTLQGTDKVNLHRNAFSGGSGILIKHPQLMSKMVLLARLGLLVSLAGTIGLMFFIDRKLWPVLCGLYFLSAFFSKYYTAAPFKVSHRGLGEISVWFAFGPMAILMASVSQNLGFHPAIIAAMPATGISTLSILLLGQMIDVKADRATGKWGVAVRLGNHVTARIYLIVQLLLVIDIILLSIFFLSRGWPVLISIIPYMIFLPGIWRILSAHDDDEKAIQTAAGMNVQLHLFFSFFLILGLGICLILQTS